MNEGTLILLSLYTGTAYSGSCLYKATRTCCNQLFPKTACYESAGVILSRGAVVYYKPSQVQFFFSIESEGRNSFIQWWTPQLFQTIKLKSHHFPSLFNELPQMTLSHPEPSDSSSWKKNILQTNLKISSNDLGFVKKLSDAGMFVTISVAILHKKIIWLKPLNL